ncbi:MAG TPA: hypothetical protein VJB98_01955 [Candidatus Paceibacterota bacterium]
MIENSQNLHSHTYLSDGKMTHRETLDIAAANGCYTVAFTDHDILIPPEIFADLKNLDHKVKWVSGIELSTGMGHVLGLFVDPHNEALRAHTVSMKEERIKKARVMAEALAQLGFVITAEEVLARAGDGGNVTKPHIVDALVAHPENIPLLETYIEKLRIAAETNEDLKKGYIEAREMSEVKGIGMYVYPIFLKSHPLVPGVHQNFSIEPSIDDGVKLIRDAGGLAVLAHWHIDKKNFPLALLEKFLSEDKLDGVETVWGLNAYGTSGETEMRADNKAVSELVRQLGKLECPSLDAHTKSDYELLGRSDFFAEQTLGMLEKIYEKFPDKKP